MEGSIRRATAEDYIALCDLLDEVDALHRDNLPQLFKKPNGPVWEFDTYWELITDENVGLFVVETDQRLAGFVHAVIRDARAIPILISRRYAIVESIGVKSECQNQGLGRRLMDTVHEWAMAQGATSIELNVYEFNQTALGFYQRLGYETLSRKMSRALGRG